MFMLNERIQSLKEEVGLRRQWHQLIQRNLYRMADGNGVKEFYAVFLFVCLPRIHSNCILTFRLEILGR